MKIVPVALSPAIAQNSTLFIASPETIWAVEPCSRNAPTAKDIVAKFKAEGFDPEGYTLQAYAAVQAYAQAANTVGAEDNKKIMEWLRAGNKVQTVVGEISFNAKGDVNDPKMVWYKFANGSYAEDPTIQ